MKICVLTKNIIYGIEVDDAERKTLKNCLNYCYHRLKKHSLTGLHVTGEDIKTVDRLRKGL